MTFLELQNDALDAVLAINTGTSSEPRTRIKRGINAWQRRILGRPGFGRLLRDTERTLTSVSGQAIYGFGPPFGRLNGIVDPTNRWPLIERDLAWLRAQDAGLSISGTPIAYIVRGWAPTQIPPTDASQIWAALSASGTDPIVWQFLLSDGTQISGTTAATGTSYVQLGTASTVVEILDLRYATTTTGRILTVREDSSTGTILGQIGPPIIATTGTAPVAARARYLRVQLWPTPTAAIAYRCDITREIADMVDDTDEPLLPPDFHFVLSLGAQHDEFRRMSDDRLSGVRSDLEQGLQGLNRWLWDLPSSYGDTPYRRHQRMSTLGPWFASGT
jgi:hypothetical protein